jgi:hypothetical protein
VLGVGSLTPGRYTQIRLVVERAELFFEPLEVEGTPVALVRQAWDSSSVPMVLSAMRLSPLSLLAIGDLHVCNACATESGIRGH